jgi:hypothetical protein
LDANREALVLQAQTLVPAEKAICAMWLAGGLKIGTSGTVS